MTAAMNQSFFTQDASEGACLLAVAEVASPPLGLPLAAGSLLAVLLSSSWAPVGWNSYDEAAPGPSERSCPEVEPEERKGVSKSSSVQARNVLFPTPQMCSKYI